MSKKGAYPNFSFPPADGNSKTVIIILLDVFILYHPKIDVNRIRITFRQKLTIKQLV